MKLEIDKLPPQDLALEEAVIGAIIISSDAMKKIGHIIKPEIFYKLDHQYIIQSILNLHNADSPIDIATVTFQLKKDGKLAEIGGPMALTELIGRVASAQNIEFHIRILWQLYIFREIINISGEASIRSYKQQEDVFSLLDDIVSKFEALDVKKQETIIKTLSEQLNIVMEQEALKDKLLYLCGYSLFDSVLNYGPNNITLIGGKSGGGKTRFLIAWMCELLRNNKDISILWGNMEDDTPKMIRCMVSHLTGIELDKLLYKEKLSPKEHVEIEVAKQLINTWDIAFVDEPKHSNEFKSIFKYFCRERSDKFCILILDNVMLLRDNNEKLQQNAIDDKICRNIKDICVLANKHGNASVIQVHHFNDEQMNKLNLKDAYRPRESHFKGSTRYRDISTQVILNNKPEQYADLLASYKHVKIELADLYITEIAKNRNSKTGIVRWFCKLDTLYFKELNYG